jgi:hypothetical protein
MSRDEIGLRSPLHWLGGLASPTWLIEGAEAPSNSVDLVTLCEAPMPPLLRCVSVPGRNHFSVLAPVTRLLAARIIGAADGRALKIDAEDLAAAP